MGEEDFVRQCSELGEKILALMSGYPKTVAACVLPGTMAVVSKVLEIPRDTFIAMFDSALDDTSE